MSILSTLFGGGRNPADAAKPYLDQVPGIGHDTYDSYINQGKDAGGKTKSAYEEMMSDPTGFINKLMEGYKPSEGYQFQKEQLTKELGNTAASGGVAGTNFDQMQQGAGVQKLLSQDMQQFLQNVLGRYDTGLKGEQGISDRGYDASKSLGDILGNNSTNQAGLAFQGEQQKNSNKNQLFQLLSQALGAIGGVASQPLSLFGNKVWG